MPEIPIPTSVRHTIAGTLILLMIVITVLNGLSLLHFNFNPLWIAGIAAWTAALLLFIDTSRILKIQVSLILLAGTGLIIYASRQAAEIDLNTVISSSTGLMTMIASVGFLRPVVIPETQQAESLPTGPAAFIKTLIGLNISSAVINVSAPILIADRIHEHSPLQRFSAQSITRVFCGVSSWSPFFGAMAVVLTYVSEASLFWIVAAGFPFMLIGFFGVLLEAKWRYPDEVKTFVGYPTHLSALKIPAMLIIAVLTTYQLLPGTSILVLIAISALTVTSLMLCIRNGVKGAIIRLTQYVAQGLPRIVNELCLFLAAGVLAAGISALIFSGILTNPYTSFDAGTAAQILCIIVLCGFIGIHPIIMISSFAPMIMSLDPDPNLLAATFLFSWNLGTCSSPLSGTNLVFQGRYGIQSWRLALWNWPYAICMLIAGCLWLQVIDLFLP